MFPFQEIVAELPNFHTYFSTEALAHYSWRSDFLLSSTGREVAIFIDKFILTSRKKI